MEPNEYLAPHTLRAGAELLLQNPAGANAGRYPLGVKMKPEWPLR